VSTWKEAKLVVRLHAIIDLLLRLFSNHGVSLDFFTKNI